jgi:hypothetical protein
MAQPAAATAETEPIAIVRDPHRPGRDRVRLEPYGVPVWALIAHLQGADWDVAQTAKDYAIPEAGVQAAVDYYRAEPQYIDAFLLLLRSTFDEFEGRPVVGVDVPSREREAG